MTIKKITTVLSTAIILSLTGCDNLESSTEHYEQAKVLIANNEQNTAIIELKNALKSYPDNVELRYLLGKTYASIGNFDSAEKELLMAYSQNFDAYILPDLAKVYALLDDQMSLAELTIKPSLSNQQKSKILFYKALGQLQQQDTDKAISFFEQSQSIDSSGQYGELSSAYLFASNKEHTKAIDLLTNLVQKDNTFPDALLLQGRLQSITNNKQQAVKSFEAYKAQLPKYIIADFYLISAYLSNKQFEKAETVINPLLKQYKEQPLLNQYKGIARYNVSDFEQASFHLNKAIQNGLVTNQAYLLAAVSAFQIENYEQANDYFEIAIKDLDTDHPANRLFAATQLKLGYEIEAADTLLAIENLEQADKILLATASFELAQNNQHNQATKLVEKYKEHASDSAKDLSTLGLLELSIDNTEGIKKLENAILLDPTLTTAKYALAAAYIKNKNYKEAQTLALQLKSEALEFGYNLDAYLSHLQGETDQAIEKYTQVLNKFPESIPANIYLAKIHFQNEDYDEAKKYIDSVLSHQKDNLIALNYYYLIATKLENPSMLNDALKSISDSAKNNPSNINFQLNYAKVLVLEKNHKEVISLLTNADNKELKQSPYYYLLLGDSFVEDEQFRKAQEIYNSWVITQPTSKTAWLRKIGLENRQNNYQSALRSINEANYALPKDNQLKYIEADTLLKTNQTDKALKVILSTPDAFQSKAEVSFLKGRIYFSQKDYQSAINILEPTYELTPSTEVVGYLFSSLVWLNKLPKAQAFLSRHVFNFPQDLNSRFLLADTLTQSKPEDAISHYAFIIKNNPKHAFALNNLAWLLLDRNAKVEADEYAQKALKIAPQDPNILDTAGWMAFNNGRKDEALSLLKKALNITPNNNEILKHYYAVKNAK